MFKKNFNRNSLINKIVFLLLTLLILTIFNNSCTGCRYFFHGGYKSYVKNKKYFEIAKVFLRNIMQKQYNDAFSLTSESLQDSVSFYKFCEKADSINLVNQNCIIDTSIFHAQRSIEHIEGTKYVEKKEIIVSTKECDNKLIKNNVILLYFSFDSRKIERIIIGQVIILK